MTYWKCNEHRIVEDWSVCTLPVYFALKGTPSSFLFLVLRKEEWFSFLLVKKLLQCIDLGKCIFLLTHTKVFGGKDSLCEIIERDYFFTWTAFIRCSKKFKNFLTNLLLYFKYLMTMLIIKVLFLCFCSFVHLAYTIFLKT